MLVSAIMMGFVSVGATETGIDLVFDAVFWKPITSQHVAAHATVCTKPNVFVSLLQEKEERYLMLFPNVLVMLSASPRMSGFIYQVRA